MFNAINNCVLANHTILVLILMYIKFNLSVSSKSNDFVEWNYNTLGCHSTIYIFTNLLFFNRLHWWTLSKWWWASIIYQHITFVHFGLILYCIIYFFYFMDLKSWLFISIKWICNGILQKKTYFLEISEIIIFYIWK